MEASPPPHQKKQKKQKKTVNQELGRMWLRSRWPLMDDIYSQYSKTVLLHQKYILLKYTNF